MGFDLAEIPRSRQHSSSEMLLSFWGLIVIIMTAAYSGNLNAFLVSVDFSAAIDSAEDILALERNFFVPVRNSIYTSLALSPYENYRRLVDVATARGGLYAMDKGWLPLEKEREVFKTGAAFIYLKV